MGYNEVEMRISRTLIINLLVPLLTLVWAGKGRTEPEGVVKNLDEKVAPMLRQYCLDCHDGDEAKGDINLESMLAPGAARMDVRLWGKVDIQLRSNLMPPPAKKQPAAEEKKQVLEWIATAEKTVRETPPIQPGIRKIRRLTRQEYSLTLRDLLYGAHDHLGDTFPADGAGGEGFDANADTLFIPPLLIEKYVEATDKGLAAAWAKPEILSRLIRQRPTESVVRAKAAEANLREFARRAYRRPATDEEVKTLVVQYAQASLRGLDFDAALKVGFKAALLSPKFLFLQEEDRKEAAQPWRLDGYEMASRLSYFLWSSMPDEELLKLAGEKKLGEAEVLTAQVKRMLADPKATAFVKSFAGQWFRFNELFNTVDPDRGKYPTFTDSVKRAMYDEAIAFSDSLLRGNGRMLDFIDCRYTYLNQELATFYQIPGVVGKEMRRVDLPDEKRGGLLGMGAVLASTAYPQRTSPVLRGKWVLEQLMGTPPPPPPPNVGQLPEDDRKLEKLTFRQQLEKHRSKPRCMGCHNRLDPPGFALENFDPVGRWRDEENGKPLDVVGNLSDGRTFRGPAEMRRMLLEEKRHFVRNLCSRLLGYALGRGLETYDQPTLLRLEEVLVQNDYRALPLVIAVAQSFPFTHRQKAGQ